jgi:hypothetical protein
LVLDPCASPTTSKSSSGPSVLYSSLIFASSYSIEALSTLDLGMAILRHLLCCRQDPHHQVIDVVPFSLASQALLDRDGFHVAFKIGSYLL